MTYLELKEDLKSTYIEVSLNLRIGRIALFHLLGRMIVADKELAKGKMQSLASHIGIDVADLGYAVMFAESYPDFEEWEGKQNKDISWGGVKRELDAKSKED